jgi:glycosyltransferase involved in cell wall biosynthesis
MRIAQLSSNVEQVPPPGYGGTELVVSLLTEELLRRGHKVTLFGVGNSETKADLVSVVDEPVRSADIPVRRWPAYDIRLLMKLREMRDSFDIVHNHMGWQALPFLAELQIPVVSTNHNLIKPYCAPIYLGYKNLPYVAISQAYRRMNFPDQLNYVATIYNGIDTQLFQGNRSKGAASQRPVFSNPAPAASKSYLLFIGRLCQDKGTEKAIQIAEKLQLPIILAGKVDNADQDYFDNCVQPYLRNPNVEFIGEVNHQQKVELYQNAIATVYPIEFDEPFGLVMAESMAAGTPVMALDRGSVKELLVDGETAIIGNTIDELIERFPEVESIDPDCCRQRVDALFSKNHMVDGYERLYERLMEDSHEGRL